MGVLSGRDILTSKFITAEITDSEDRIHYVAIKHTIGDYFVADLDGKFFAFTLKNARILTHRVTMTKFLNVFAAEGIIKQKSIGTSRGLE